VVAATNKDLKKEISEGRFRQDLFYRLNVIAIHIPPLRERPDDIPPLALAFLERHAPGRGIRLSRGALELLKHQPWEGNARELENALERALLLASGDEIQVSDLPSGGDPKAREGTAQRPERELLTSALEKQMSLRELSDLYTERILELVHGNKVRAARILGINRRTLYRRGENRHREAVRNTPRETH
jgi:DNA-binding NtrC family response regulator